MLNFDWLEGLSICGHVMILEEVVDRYIGARVRWPLTADTPPVSEA